MAVGSYKLLCWEADAHRRIPYLLRSVVWNRWQILKSPDSYLGPSRIVALSGATNQIGICSRVPDECMAHTHSTQPCHCLWAHAVVPCWRLSFVGTHMGAVYTIA